MPGYWMNETSGRLRPAVEALIWGAQLATEQIVLVRDYLRQWINGDFQGETVWELRRRVDLLVSTQDIHEWLDDAVAIGIDPL